MLKTVIALAATAGFAAASFAQGVAPVNPADTATKSVAPAHAATDKKVEAPKATPAMKTAEPKASAATGKGVGKPEAVDEKQAIKHEAAGKGHDKGEVAGEKQDAQHASVSSKHGAKAATRHDVSSAAAKVDGKAAAKSETKTEHKTEAKTELQTPAAK